MKRTLFPALLLVVLAAILGARVTQRARVTGIYSTMRSSVQTGDVSGFEIFVLQGVDKSFVLVQEAEGAPGYPVLVEARLTDSTLTFDLKETILRGLGDFTGRFQGTQLRGKFTGVAEPLTLSRGRSFWQ
jgi:hypothetical protein